MAKVERLVFSREYKLGLVRRLLAGEGVLAVATEQKIRRNLLYNWRDKYRSGGEAALRLSGGQPRVDRGCNARRRPPARCRRRQLWSRPGSVLRHLSKPLAGSSWIWIFFAQPCGKSGGGTRRPMRLAPRHLQRHPRDDDPDGAGRIKR